LEPGHVLRDAVFREALSPREHLAPTLLEAIAQSPVELVGPLALPSRTKPDADAAAGECRRVCFADEQPASGPGPPLPSGSQAPALRSWIHQVVDERVSQSIGRWRARDLLAALPRPVASSPAAAPQAAKPGPPQPDAPDVRARLEQVRAELDRQLDRVGALARDVAGLDSRLGGAELRLGQKVAEAARVCEARLCRLEEGQGRHEDYNGRADPAGLASAEVAELRLRKVEQQLQRQGESARDFERRLHALATAMDSGLGELAASRGRARDGGAGAAGGARAACAADMPRKVGGAAAFGGAQVCALEFDLTADRS